MGIKFDKDMALEIMKCEKMENIIVLLQDLGFWDDDRAWRFLGDNENNYSSIGNQQSHPVASLVEKVVNSFDAIILNIAKTMKINLFNIKNPKQTKKDIYERLVIGAGGDVKELSKLVSISMTGMKSPDNPNITIADRGEGQTPKNMPETIMSLAKSNKIRIPIVQGKHNMGGSGVAKFTDLQVILSRKNPDLVNDSPEDLEWGITVVRRKPPTGNMRSSVIEYLAPIGSDVNEKKGEIISFNAKTMPIMPSSSELCGIEVEYGTFIKLFNYDIGPYKSSILIDNGLGHALKLQLPEMFIPIRICEFRDFKFQGGRNVYAEGLTDHINSRGQDILEENFPLYNTITLGNETLNLTTYVFKKNKFSKFLRSTGVVFVLNGQTHASLDSRLYTKNNVKLNEISKDILTVVECSNLSNVAIESLFMNSRDRLVNSSFAKEVLKQIEAYLANDADLKGINDRRIQELIKDKITDNKPLANALSKVLKNNNLLSNLLDLGIDIASNQKKDGNNIRFDPLSDELKVVAFKPKNNPTVFKIRGVNIGEVYNSEIQQTKKVRITLTTDARNDLLNISPEWKTTLKIEGVGTNIPHQLKLKNGIGKLIFDLPNNSVPGDLLIYTFKLINVKTGERFANHMKLTVIEDKLSSSNGGGGGGSSKMHKSPATAKSSLKLPKIVDVIKDEWGSHGFNNKSVLKITKTQEEYVFFFNVDNKILKSEVNSAGRIQRDLVKSKFIYGMTMLALSGIGLIEEQADLDLQKQDGKFSDLEDVIKICEGFAPFIIPTLNMLNAITVKGDIEVA